MTPEEARSFLAESEIDYATASAESKGWTLDEALARTKGTLKKILPQHEATPGHDFAWIVHDGSRVGRVWLGPTDDEPQALYIWDITVNSDQRGRGYGGAALDAITTVARDKGLTRVSLSVFEHNQGARQLYERKGYEVTATGGGQVHMTLRLD